MSSSSTNLNLTLPDPGERLSLNVLNANWDKIDAFAGKVLPQSGQELTDLDNVTTQGVYSYDKLTSAMTHAPNTGTYFTGTLFVDYYNANKVTQMFIQSAGRVFTRHKWNGTWGDWVELAPGNITEYSGTKNDTYISAIEGRVVKYGKMVSGYFVITANADFLASDLTLISNLPPAYNGQIQLTCVCLSGDDIWKATRVRVTASGTITTWYGFTFKSGKSYLISVNYVCS